MLFLFSLDNIVEYLKAFNPEFLQHQNSAMLSLLGIVNRKLNRDYAIPSTYNWIEPPDPPFHWNARSEFIIERDILVVLNLLREASITDYDIELCIIRPWLFGIRLT